MGYSRNLVANPKNYFSSTFFTTCWTINLVTKVLPPTVAPTRATERSIGMLKPEFSASHVSAKAFNGMENAKTLVKRNAITGSLVSMFPCKVEIY